MFYEIEKSNRLITIFDNSFLIGYTVSIDMLLSIGMKIYILICLTNYILDNVRD